MTTGLAAEASSPEHFGLIRRMADDLAHELKNPLNSVVINLEVLRTRVMAGRTEAALERIEVIESELQRLNALLDHLLRLVRPDRVGVDSFAVDEVLAEAADLAQVLARPAGCTFRLEPLGEFVQVRAAREPLRLAVLILAEAAIHAVPRDSLLRLHGAVRDGRVLIHLDAPAAAAGALTEAAALVRRSFPNGGMLLEESGSAGSCRTTLILPRSG